MVNHSKLSFDTKEELGDKIGKLAVMIGKLATRERVEQTGNLNLKSIRVEVEVRTVTTITE